MQQARRATGTCVPLVLGAPRALAAARGVPISGACGALGGRGARRRETLLHSGRQSPARAMAALFDFDAPVGHCDVTKREQDWTDRYEAWFATPHAHLLEAPAIPAGAAALRSRPRTGGARDADSRKKSHQGPENRKKQVPVRRRAVLKSVQSVPAVGATSSIAVANPALAPKRSASSQRVCPNGGPKSREAAPSRHAAGQPPSQPAARGTRPGRARSAKREDNTDLHALLAAHNKKFAAKHTYEPRLHSVRDVRMVRGAPARASSPATSRS